MTEQHTNDGRFNFWLCEKCGQFTIGVHRDAGVTPFMIGCHARPSCDGTARSMFYPNYLPNGFPIPAVVHLEWYRPRSEQEFEEGLVLDDGADREWWANHVRNGGCMRRTLPGSYRHKEVTKFYAPQHGGC